MNTRSMLIAAGAACLALAVPAAAGAAPAPRATTLAAGHSPGIDVDAAGVAHVAFSPRSDGAEPLTYCAIARAGRLGCAGRALFDDGGTVGLASRIVVQAGLAPNSVSIISARFGRPEAFALDESVVVHSGDGGASFGAPIALGIGFTDADFGSDGTVTVAGSVIDTIAQRVGVLGPLNQQVATLLPDTRAGASVEHYRGRPLVVASRASGEQWTLWSGNGDPNDAGSWSPPSRDFTDAVHYDLDSGPRGVLFTGARQAPTERLVELRRFTGRGFTRPVVVNRARPAGDIDATTSAQDGRGRVLVAWHDRSDQSIWVSASRDGRRFSRPRPIARGAGRDVEKLQVSLDAQGRGLAIWERGGNTIMGTRLTLTRALSR